MKNANPNPIKQTFKSAYDHFRSSLWMFLDVNLNNFLVCVRNWHQSHIELVINTVESLLTCLQNMWKSQNTNLSCCTHGITVF